MGLGCVGIACEIEELNSDVSKGQGEACGAEAGPDFDTRERQGLAAAPMGDDATAAHISHVICRGHFSRHPKNVAIPTKQIQSLNEP